MVRIPFYEQQTVAGVGPAPAQAPVGLAAAAGGALAGGISDAARAAAVWAQKHQQAREAAAVTESVTGAMGELMQLEESATTAPDWRAAQKSYDDQVKAIESRWRDRLPSGLAKADFDQSWMRTKLATGISVRRTFFKREQDEAVAQLNTTVDLLSRQAAGAPNDVVRQGLVEEMNAAIARTAAAGWIDQTAAQAYSQRARTQTAEAAIERVIRQSPGQAYGALLEADKGRGGALSGYWNDLPADRRDVLMRSARAERNRIEAEARQRRAEAQAVYLAGYQDELAFNRSGRLNPNTIYTEDGLKAAFGAERGGQLWGALERAKDVGAVVQELRTADPQTTAALLQEYEQRQASPENFRANQADAEDVKAALVARNREILADPAAYAVRWSPAVRERWQNLQATISDPAAAPEDRQAASSAVIAASLGEQERLGVPPDQRRLLPQSYVDGVRNSFSTAGTDAESTVQMLHGLKDMWGDNWPRVYGELVAAKAFPAVGPEQAAEMEPGAATRLLQATAIPENDLVNTLPDGTSKKDVESAVNGALDDLRLSMAAQGRVLTEKFPAWQNATLRLALRYTAGGASPQEAARRAADEVVNSRYVYRQDDSGAMLRIPAEVDADAVMGGARGVIDRLTPADLAPVAADTGLPGDLTQQRYVESLQATHSWATSPREDGLMLLDATLSPVLRADGRPFVVTWDDLMKANALRRPPTTWVERALGLPYVEPPPNSRFLD